MGLAGCKNDKLIHDPHESRQTLLCRRQRTAISSIDMVALAKASSAIKVATSIEADELNPAPMVRPRDVKAERCDFDGNILSC